jgi:hypothetical protein
VIDAVIAWRFCVEDPPMGANVPTIYGPEPLLLDGRWGQRYWIHNPFPWTGNALVDERLSSFPVAVFQPERRPATETPLVVALQGMASPYQGNAFLVPTLLDMGIACVFFDTPLAGERSLVRNCRADILSEIAAVVRENVTLDFAFAVQGAAAVASDFHAVLHLAAERHGLCDGRVALFGVSLGVLLTSYAFLRDGVGQRLLGAIGHADLPRFARSYAPRMTPFLCALPLHRVGHWLARFTGKQEFRAGADFLQLLNSLALDSDLNPLFYADRAGPNRRVRFLVGAADRLVKPRDAQACAARFPDGECYVVPRLGHGGDGFIDHVRYFIGTQLGDWASWRM